MIPVYRVLEHRLLPVLLALLAAICLIGIVRIAVTLQLPVVFNFDEGWNAYHQAEAISGLNPYPPPDSLWYNVYPPLSFYIVGALGLLTGDNIVAGRIISLLSFLFIALGTFALARQMGGRRSAAAFAALLLMGILLFDHPYVGTNMPQMLGTAIGMAGLVLALHPRRTTAKLILAALFFVIAAFTKHNCIMAPLAVTLWLFLTDRPSAYKLAAAGLVFGLSGAAIFQAVFGVPLWEQLDSARIWRFSKAAIAIGGRLPAMIAPAIAVFLLHRRIPADKYLGFCLIYFAIAFPMAAIFLGGSGTGGNMLADAEIALALMGGIGLDRLLRAEAGRFTPVYAACFAVPVVVMALVTAATGRFPRYWLDHNAPAVRDAQIEVAYLKQHPGRAVCLKLALCYWAGKKVETDLWNVEQSVAKHRRDGHKLLNAIATRQYAVLHAGAPPNALGSASDTQNAFSAEAARTIMAHYRMGPTTHDGTFWLAKPRNAAPKPLGTKP